MAGLGGAAAWIAAPKLFPDQPSILTDFLGILYEQSRQLEPGGRRPVPLPPLDAGESLIVAMGPYVTQLGKDIDLSERARETIVRHDIGAEGAALTFLYLVNKGEIRHRERVSRCNLTIAGYDALVITSSSDRIAYIECGPVVVPSRPDECRNMMVGLWNERCAARLVPR
jgi:hypothetical protein